MPPELKTIIEENSPKPRVVPGTDSPKRMEEAATNENASPETGTSGLG